MLIVFVTLFVNGPFVLFSAAGVLLYYPVVQRCYCCSRTCRHLPFSTAVLQTVYLQAANLSTTWRRNFLRRAAAHFTTHTRIAA